jgi:hypothetical protein
MEEEGSSTMMEDFELEKSKRAEGETLLRENPSV